MKCPYCDSDRVIRRPNPLLRKIAEMSASIDTDPAIPSGDWQWRKGYQQACSDIIAMIEEQVHPDR